MTAHRLALHRAPEVGFARLIISATAPLAPDDLATLGTDAPAVVRRLFPHYEALYAQPGWRMFPATQPTDASVDAFLDAIEDRRQREDSRTICRMRAEETGQPPRM